MPVNETVNTVTVGRICLSCTFFATKECPYKNHDKQSITTFTGDIRGKCIFYDPIAEAAASREGAMIKKACDMKDSELNIDLFKKVMALTSKDRKKLFEYWDYIYPADYAEDMVTDDVETKQRGTGKKSVKPKDIKEIGKNKKNKSKKNPKWYGENKFPEPFKS